MNVTLYSTEWTWKVFIWLLYNFLPPINVNSNGNTGLGNETGKFQHIKKIDTWTFYLFIGYKWKAYE